ncbi:hypothetical protein F2Q69_00015446 [Brassica cretica]|uniref:Uncharacterized protein n=1 Tax=Brassica cretica TaxID=69181 RepID=A0A8S9QVR2_BRACR|nr:hypothetical protein F2Q69_00015446 [Brassica cretica]
MMHLSLSKSIITGFKEPVSHGDATPGTNLLMDQKEKQLKLLKEAKPVIKVSNQGNCLTPLLNTGTDVYSHGTWIPDESHKLTEVTRTKPEHELNQNPHHKWKPKTEQSVVQVPKPEGSVKKNIKTELKYYKKMVIPAKSVEKFSGCKEKSFKEIPSNTLLMLGESAPKMANKESTRKSHQTSQTGHLGDTSDRRSVQGSYLDNQKDFVYEINFTRRITHQGVIEAWNFKKIFTDQNVMNFINWKFSSPSS